MDFSLFLVMLVLGFIGSFFSGLLGIGGAIINYPLLLFIPSILGVAHFTGQEVSAISMFQVFFASLAGVLAYRKKNSGNSSLIHKGLVLYMGISILIGSLIGGMSSKYLSGETINIVYGVLAIIAVVLMLFPSKGKRNDSDNPLDFNKTIAIVSAFLVGIVSGVVGAGGAFILIPIMLTVLRIPTRVTIASSLAIVFISAVGGVIGKLTTGHIPLLPTVFVVVGSLLGAPIGSKMSAKIDAKYLRYGLVVLIALTAIKIWSSIL
ncbi:sulfite exporter TauE/SafE family protein [Brevibacillus borstelensis]|uniref:sulfite exporter TauE/SafE family protein n=1 Tax=Brevibacillus borstelensis TaxID=45462 RepID=UPI00046ADBCD|nr:sulfite exporter TauE/SafE family protein [Brevibacillus borstelensis]MCC0567110.1 sulfite exporter TauE/SafE family protein [Brevibacillus borstelensis]MCM3473442.1 sulfite exporter TauE/SafE family protein [Brevibacillus borstelensis]MCM3561470.1 sulfite exporter TauE/SafE family protein [Brevibacillus borstelensis]MCM3593607.1 sulfite exporter TauE/SafE family protein [Brevibacillus borstelensis]MED1850048.1 sulfite exporter TauE/SafE family protein [Brevibacillus borstelensis]